MYALGRLAMLLALPFHDAVSQEWEVRGLITGPAPGYPGATVSIPSLRVGTIAGRGGSFKIRASGSAPCYELVIRPYTLNRSVFRFQPPPPGQRLDLGDIPMRPYPPITRSRRTPLPVVGDTMGTCAIAEATPDDSWPSVHARLEGRLTRGGVPLPGVPLDLRCGLTFIPPRVVTDADGSFVFEIHVNFPADQVLAQGEFAACRLVQATVTIDPPVDLILPFAPVAGPPRTTRLDWALPQPDFSPAHIIADRGELMHQIRLGHTAAVSVGVLTRPQFVTLSIWERPARVMLHSTPACTFPPGTSRAWGWTFCEMTLTPTHFPAPAFLLPFAIHLTTGRKVPTTGSTIYLYLPPDLADSLKAGVRMDAWARVPARYGQDANAYVQVPTSYDKRLLLMSLTLVDLHFDDERSTVHEFQAEVVFTLRR